jgi:thiamine biosynthesis lipoprotein
MLTQLNQNCLIHTFHRLYYFILLLSSVLIVSACSDKPTGPQIIGSTMGTSYSIQWSDSSAKVSKEAISHEVALRLEEINALMSTYIPSSQLSQFNQSRDIGWHAVDVELASLIQQALTICQQSAGAFDITVGPLVNLWGFGANDASFQFPSTTEIDITMRSIGCQHIDTRLTPPAINKKLADIYVDLSAIAKGYAVDELAKILDAHQLKHYMVEIGGEVKAKGIAPHGSPWRIGIETPHPQRGSIEGVISLSNFAVATSGDYRNYFEHEGQRYSHTIDPITGYPIKHQLASVTILNESTAIADAWATAFMVLGANKSLKLAKTLNLSGLLITRHGTTYETTRFGEMSHHISE